ncbi:MAG: PAS domain S-box protein, partial [Dehalococcoidia bacterium]
MPTTVPITRARRVLILLAAVAFGAVVYVIVDFGGVSDAVDASADLNELMAASQAVHRIAETPLPASAGDLGGAIIRMRTAHAAAFDNVGDVLGDLRATTAESTVGARLASFEAAARDYRANEIDAGSLDAAYYAVVDELDALLLAVSTVSAGEAARLRTLLLVAGVATALATTVLLVGLRFWHRRLIESVQQLQSSDERFRRSLDNAADAVVITDSEMKVIYANAAACRLSGYELDAVLGRVYSEFWVDFDLDATVAADQLNALGAVRFTRDSQRADGTIITVEHDVIALGDGTFLGVAHDATERLKTQAALVESEQRFRTVIDTMQNALVIIDEDRRPIMVNHALAELLGYRESEILAFDQANLLVHPDTRGLLVQLTDRVRTGELGPTPFRARLIKKDGGAVDVEGLLSPFILKDGSRAVLAEAKDVTEQLIAERGRREAVHEMRLGEARLSRAQQIAHIGSWELDLGTQQGWWSDEQFRLVGLEPQSVEPSFELFLSFVHADDRDRVQAAIEGVVESGDPVDIQYRIVREDGEERIVSGHGEIVHDESGRAITAQGTTRDVTEDVRVREELAEAQKLQAVGTLAAGIAHDFNN